MPRSIERRGPIPRSLNAAEDYRKSMEESERLERRALGTKSKAHDSSLSGNPIDSYNLFREAGKLYDEAAKLLQMYRPQDHLNKDLARKLSHLLAQAGDSRSQAYIAPFKAIGQALRKISGLSAVLIAISVLGLYLLTPILTGNAIAELPQKVSIGAGIVLLIVALAILILLRKRKNENNVQEENTPKKVNKKRKN